MSKHDSFISLFLFFRQTVCGTSFTKIFLMMNGYGYIFINLCDENCFKKTFFVLLPKFLPLSVHSSFRSFFIDGPVPVAKIVIFSPLYPLLPANSFGNTATYRHTYKKVSTVQLPGMLLIEKYLPMRYFLLISVYTAK